MYAEDFLGLFPVNKGYFGKVRKIFYTFCALLNGFRSN